MEDVPAASAPRLILNAEHFRTVVLDGICRAGESVLIATANVKDLHVVEGRKSVSIVERLAGLAGRGVKVGILHSSNPGPRVRESLSRVPPGLIGMRMCRRLHMKAVIVDGRSMYLGSANLTGAGLGARGEGKRNFEAGIWTGDRQMIDRVLALFGEIWSGAVCTGCRLRDACERGARDR